MSFFERYESLCAKAGFKPGSEQAAQMIGSTRAAISVWRKKGKVPMPDALVAIANAYGVSTDWLLERTDDPTDYSNPDLVAALGGPQLDEFNGDVRKALAFQQAVAADAAKEATLPGISLYIRLDPMDKGKAEGYMQGLLSQEKYFEKAVQTEQRKKQA